MKKHISRALVLFFSMVLLLNANIPASAAQVVKDQREVYIATSEKNSSYVYLSAEAPFGWCGNLIATFRNKATGKEYKAEMNFIPEEWISGIWLPFGTYTVKMSIVEDDGMCLVGLKDPSQETFKVEKGKDITMPVLVIENPDYEYIVPTRGPDFVPPLPEEEYQDVPWLTSVPTESPDTAAEDTEPTSEPEVTEENEITVTKETTGISRVLVILGATAAFIVLVFSIVYILRKKVSKK